MNHRFVVVRLFPFVFCVFFLNHVWRKHRADWVQNPSGPSDWGRGRGSGYSSGWSSWILSHFVRWETWKTFAKETEGTVNSHWSTKNQNYVHERCAQTDAKTCKNYDAKSIAAKALRKSTFWLYCTDDQQSARKTRKRAWRNNCSGKAKIPVAPKTLQTKAFHPKNLVLGIKNIQKQSFWWLQGF